MFEIGHAATVQWARRDVDLDIELTEFGLIVGIGDGIENGGVRHRRRHLGVDQVQFDFHPDLRFAHVEGPLCEHLRQCIETVLNLLPEPVSILPGEFSLFDLLAHRRSPCLPHRPSTRKVRITASIAAQTSQVTKGCASHQGDGEKSFRNWPYRSTPSSP